MQIRRLLTHLFRSLFQIKYLEKWNFCCVLQAKFPPNYAHLFSSPWGCFSLMHALMLLDILAPLPTFNLVFSSIVNPFLINSFNFFPQFYTCRMICKVSIHADLSEILIHFFATCRCLKLRSCLWKISSFQIYAN